MFTIDEVFSDLHFGIGVTGVFCHYDLSAYQEDLFQLYDIVYIGDIKRSVKKRQAEFLAGRYCAKRALVKLGGEPCHIPIGRHRAPQWPQGVIGSISHDTQTACAIVAHSEDIRFVGVDIEPIVTEENMKAINELAINDCEKVALEKTELNVNEATTLVFSAKESVFKALYPYVGNYFDFSAAHCLNITEDGNKYVGTVCLEITQNLSKQIFQYTKINVRYVVYGERVITWIHC